MSELPQEDANGTGPSSSHSHPHPTANSNASPDADANFHPINNAENIDMSSDQAQSVGKYHCLGYW